MNKTSCKLVESLIRNWYAEFRVLDYCGQYPSKVNCFNGNYDVQIRPSSDRINFCSSVLIEKVVQIARAACVDFHATCDENGLVFTLH